MSGRVNARCQCAGRDPVVRLRCHGSGAAAALGGSPRHGRRAGRLRRRQIRASTGRRGPRQPPSSSSSRSGLPGWPKPNRRRWTSAPGSPARSTMCSRTASPRSRCTWRRHGLLTERGPPDAGARGGGPLDGARRDSQDLLSALRGRSPRWRTTCDSWWPRRSRARCRRRGAAGADGRFAELS